METEKEMTAIQKTQVYLENYREIERYIKDAISEVSQIDDVSRYNISAEKAFLQSIRECKAETVILFEHMKKALASLKEDAEAAGEGYKYDALEAVYIKGKSYEDIVRETGCGKNSPKKWCRSMTERLSIKLFGAKAIENDKIGVKGELFVFALYSGNDDNNSLQWLEHSVPFYEEVECPGCSSDMIPNVEIAVPQSDLKVKQDEDGEERIISVDTVLELEMKIYEEEELSLLMDVYTPVRDCQAIREKQKLENLLVKNFSKCKVNDRIKTENSQGKILQICHSDGNVKVDSTRIVENGIETEGVVRVRILYIVSDDEMPFYAMETMIPFTHVIEAKGINEQCVYHLRTDLEQLSTTMIDSDEIEVKIVMNLNALVMNQTEMGIIREIEERELDREKLKSMPGIVGYQVQQGDTLWDIAKKFYTTIENIMELNGLESEEVKPGDSLLLMKKVER